MRDLAAELGLSPTSVSMILNEKHGFSFSEETVERVKKTARRLNYQKRAPSKDRVFHQQIVAVFTPNVTNHYYAILIQAIEQVAQEKNIKTIIVNAYRDIELEKRYLNMLKQTDLAGIIFTLPPQSRELIEEVNQSIPVVVIADRNDQLKVDTVELDNYSAGALIARHMLQLGHRHIAYISTTLSNIHVARMRRLQGMQEVFRTGCPEADILVKSRTVTPADELGCLDIEYKVGYELTRECLSLPHITAFAAVNDMVAYGVLDLLAAEGLRVPEDYSVCGFDNLFPSRFSAVSLTSVEHYIAERGRTAMEILYGKLENGPKTKPLNSFIRVEYRHMLIERTSTGQPRTVPEMPQRSGKAKSKTRTAMKEEKPV
jgi:LacI family transcriptional regulator